MVRPIRNGMARRNMRHTFREEIEKDFISEKIYISFEGSATRDYEVNGIIENLGYTKENQYYLDDDWGDFQITNYSKKVGKFNIELIVKEGTRHDPGYYRISIKSDSNDIDWEELDASLSRLNFDEGRDLNKLETVLRGFTNESYRRSERRTRRNFRKY